MSPDSDVAVCPPGDNRDFTGLLTHPGKRRLVPTPGSCQTVHMEMRATEDTGPEWLTAPGVGLLRRGREIHYGS